MSPGVEFLTPDEEDEEQPEEQGSEESGETGEAEAAEAFEGEEGEHEPTPEEIEAAEARKRVAAVSERIRADSREVRLTDPAIFLAEPFSYEQEQLDRAWAEMTGDEQYRDIVCTNDPRTGADWWHSEVLITVPYARLMLRKQANDPVYMIVESVRERSQVYPEPFSSELFAYEPFSLRLGEVLAHVEAIKADPAYSDVHTFETSNGVLYLYSDRYLTEKQARAKAEWAEVESRYT